MSTPDVLLNRVKVVKTYKPQIYVYKAIYYNTTKAAAGTSQNLADSLSNLWRLYIDAVLNLSGINYTVYTLALEVQSTTGGAVPVPIYYILTYTYLIFEFGVFIPAFSNGGSRPAYGLNNTLYSFVTEQMQMPNIPSGGTASTTQMYPMPMKLFGNYDLLTMYNNNNILLKSAIPLTELYGGNSIKGLAQTIQPSWYAAYRYTFDQLNVDTYSQGVQFIMENINFPVSDTQNNAPIPMNQVLSNFYQNVVSETSSVNPNDNAETSVIVNEILTQTKSINIRTLMMQSPQLFIKYGEYLLLVYRYAVTHSLGPLNNL